MQYRITCTVKQQYSGHPYPHIVQVGLGDDSGWREQVTTERVIQLIQQGHQFYTIGSFTKEPAYVEVYKCPTCAKLWIRTRPDDTRDNNLDNLAQCKL